MLNKKAHTSNRKFGVFLKYQDKVFSKSKSLATKILTRKSILVWIDHTQCHFSLLFFDFNSM